MGELPLKHSRFGIISCLTAISVWLYFVVVFLLVFYVDGFTRVLSDALIPESHGISDFRGMGTAVVIFAVLFFFIPIIGHLAGLLLGVVGLLRTGSKRLFATAGVALNLLPAAVLLVFYAIGSMMPA